MYHIVQSSTGNILETVDGDWNQAQMRVIILNKEGKGVFARKYKVFKKFVPSEFGTTLFVDAWSSGNPGIGGCRVVNTKKEVVTEWNSKLEHSNNYFELMAIGIAVKFCLDKGVGRVNIYSDSNTALAWIWSGMHQAKADQNVISETITKINKMLLQLNNTVILNKWDTEAHGEISADYNRK